MQEPPTEVKPTGDPPTSRPPVRSATARRTMVGLLLTALLGIDYVVLLTPPGAKLLGVSLWPDIAWPFMFSQVALASAWLVLARQPLWIRVLPLAVCMVIWNQVLTLLLQRGNAWEMLIFFTLCQSLFLGMVWLTGVRLILPLATDDAVSEPTKSAGGQFSLRQLLAVIAIVAIYAAGIRFLALSELKGGTKLTFRLMVYCSMSAIGALVWAVPGDRLQGTVTWLARRLILATLALAPVGLVILLLGSHGSRGWGYLLWHLPFVVLLLCYQGVLHLAGYRLARQGDPAER